MAGSSFGTIFKLSTFGESHGPAIGGVIDGVPANIPLSLEAIQDELARRKPGQSSIVTQRMESDLVQILSGVFEGKTTGTSIGFIIPNEDQKSKDYSHIKDAFRPSHADYTYEKKYGIRDYRGGGRSSARETACRVVAGAIAKQILETKGIDIVAYVDQVGSIKIESEIDFNEIDNNPVRCASKKDAKRMESLIKKIKKAGETFSIELEKTQDILESCGKTKQNQILVGFALETNNEIVNALSKLERKNLDAIILNSLKYKGAGFASDTNKVTFIDHEQRQVHFELKSKTAVANDIMNEILNKIDA